MSQPYNWEEVDIPRGSFIGWGLRPGQKVVGKVLDYTPTGGTDFNQEPCPALTLELLEDAYSANKAQQYTKIDRGELVTLNCGQVQLQRGVRTADPKPGDVIAIELTSVAAGAGRNGGDVKEFGIKIARGAGGPVTRPQAQQQPQFAQSAPNFGAPAPAAAPQSDPWGSAPVPAAAPAGGFGGSNDEPPF